MFSYLCAAVQLPSWLFISELLLRIVEIDESAGRLGVQPGNPLLPPSFILLQGSLTICPGAFSSFHGQHWKIVHGSDRFLSARPQPPQPVPQPPPLILTGDLFFSHLCPPPPVPQPLLLPPLLPLILRHLSPLSSLMHGLLLLLLFGGHHLHPAHLLHITHAQTNPSTDYIRERRRREEDGNPSVDFVQSNEISLSFSRICDEVKADVTVKISNRKKQLSRNSPKNASEAR